MAREMGIGVLGGSQVCFKRKFRWMFYIQGVVGEGANMLPPEKASRPSLSFKEIQAEHLNETIYFAGKPDWKQVSVTLFDLKTNTNPIFDWLKKQYDTCGGKGDWKRPGLDWKREATIEMYDGCGNTIEKWVLMNSWPSTVEWGDMDMGQSEYTTVDLTLRYDRAWIEGC